jgi:hypothetical protein
MIICCDKTAMTKIDGAGSDAAEVAAVDAQSAAELATGPRFRREEGCARDFRPGGSTSADLAELGRLCAQGMAPVADAVTAPLQAGGAEATFRVTARGACLRAGAAAQSGAVSLSLVAPSGDVLTSATSADPTAVAPIDGTVCVREPGAYRAVVRVAPAVAEPSSVTIQVWQAKKEE